MPVYQNLDGTTRSEFQIGKTNTIKFRTNSGIIEWQNVDGYWHKLQVQCYIKTADPTVDDDLDLGYLVTDWWFNNVSNAVFICENNSNGAAVWTQISGGTGGAGDANKKTITQATHGFAAKDAIRYNGTAWVKAQSDSAINAEALGIVESVNGNDFTMVMSGYITLSGLTAGSLYFLDAITAGLLTTTEPSVAGQVSKPLMFAISTTVGIVINMRGLVLPVGGTLGQTYVHSQTAASVTWTVQHSLGSYDPLVQCYNASGSMIFPDTVTINDQNTVTLTFNPAVAGKAVVLAALGRTSGLQPGCADVRLDYNSTTSVKLQGVDATSKKIVVNSYAVDCSTALVCNKTDNLITSAGADAGSAMSVSTLYYGYVSNHLATFAPSSLRFSTTAPTNGYLGATGNAANWRYVGDCYLWSDGNFKDEATIRAVRSEYNVIWKSLQSYNTTSSWNPSGATRELNGGTGQVRGYFLGDAKSSIVVTSSVNVWVRSDASNAFSGIGYDATTGQEGSKAYGYNANAGGVQFNLFSNCKVTAPAKGLHYFTQLEIVGSNTGVYFYGVVGGGIVTQCGELNALVPM